MVRTRSSSLPGDPQALAGAVRRLAADDALAERVARAGRETFEAHASEDVLGARWRSLLERAAASRMTRPARLVAGGCAAFAAGLGALAVLQHRAFWTGRFDVGNLTQAVWSTAHGDVLSVTGLTGRQISRLGAHFDPIVVLFAPLWWVWPDASMLLVTQALAVATGAIPVYLLARRHLRSDWAAAGFGLAYLLHPATQWLVLDDFHPVALATPLLLWGFWFLDSDRLVAFARGRRRSPA